MTDHLIEFAKHMADMGLATRHSIKDDGLLHRIHIEGDRPGTVNGWYVLYTEGAAAGAFGSWRTGYQSKWSAKLSEEMTAVERAGHRARLQQMRQQRDRERNQRQQKTADYAAKLWSSATPADLDHPYLERKGIQPHHLRQHKGLLLVPMINAGGKLWNLQRIAPDGTKRFLSGGRVNGCFSFFGELDVGTLYICEGTATGATIHQQSGLPTACAMNAGNLLAVSSVLADPSRQITLCADNDHRTDGNPGITKGREAAKATGSALTWPKACGPDCICTDFNDEAHCQKAQEIAS